MQAFLHPKRLMEFGWALALAAAAYTRVEVNSIAYLILFALHFFLGHWFKGTLARHDVSVLLIQQLTAGRRFLLWTSLVYSGVMTLTMAGVQLAWAFVEDAFPPGSSAYDLLTSFGFSPINADVVTGVVMVLPDTLVLLVAGAAIYFSAFKKAVKVEKTIALAGDLDAEEGVVDVPTLAIPTSNLEARDEFEAARQLRMARTCANLAEACLVLALLSLGLTSGSLPSLLTVFYALFFWVSVQSWSGRDHRWKRRNGVRMRTRMSETPLRTEMKESDEKKRTINARRGISCAEKRIDVCTMALTANEAVSSGPFDKMVNNQFKSTRRATSKRRTIEALAVRSNSEEIDLADDNDPDVLVTGLPMSHAGSVNTVRVGDRWRAPPGVPAFAFQDRR